MSDEAAPPVATKISKFKWRRASHREPVGLGGWLLLPLLHLAYKLGLNLYALAQALLNIEHLIGVARGSTDLLAAMRLPTALSLLSILLVIVMAPIGLYSILVRSPRAPRIMVTFYLVLCVAGGLQAAATTMTASILGQRPDPSAKDALSDTFFWSTAGIVYFNRSRRVANTFGPRKEAIEKAVSKAFA